MPSWLCRNTAVHGCDSWAKLVNPNAARLMRWLAASVAALVTVPGRDRVAPVPDGATEPIDRPFAYSWD